MLAFFKRVSAEKPFGYFRIKLNRPASSVGKYTLFLLLLIIQIKSSLTKAIRYNSRYSIIHISANIRCKLTSAPYMPLRKHEFVPMNNEPAGSNFAEIPETEKLRPLQTDYTRNNFSLPAPVALKRLIIIFPSY